MIFFHRNTAQCPVLIFIYYKIFMWPCSVYTYSSADAGRCRYLTPFFTGVEFFPSFFRWVIYGEETIPFFMYPLADDAETPFWCFFITFHFFIIQAIVAKHNRVSSIPPFLVIYA